MKRPAAFFPIALAGVAIILAPRVAQAQSAREEGSVEIEKCQTIGKPGSYKLVRNLTATGNCLVITTDFVTIDLAGFLISGGNSGTGILAAPPSSELQGIAVRNGSVVLFANAVDLSGAAGSIVEGLRVFGSEPSGTAPITNFGITASGIVRGNIVSGVTLVGITASGTVTGNNSSNNFHEGISAGVGTTLVGNTANFNAPPWNYCRLSC